MQYDMTIGLEIHAELATRTKMFCACPNDPDEKTPNVNICPICLAHPGTLPTINEEAIRKLIKVGLALGCEITRHSKFDRKNYFYPDLPKGYQISQYDLPVCTGGRLLHIGIERIHMEEDTGTLKHEGKNTLVDFNRAGIPLMELVTKPEITSPEQVEKFARELQLILRYLDASDADMEKGQMRVEVNISVKPRYAERRGLNDADLRGKSQRGSAQESESALSALLGTKVEVKNINSINAAMRAAQYEFKRQTEALEKGEKIIQETRGWDEKTQSTFSQRLKEGSADYRYFPEPDLPPMHFEDEEIEHIRAELPELPAQRRIRFVDEYGITPAQVEIFTVTKELGDYFEEVVSELGDSKLNALAANYIIGELPSNVTAENFAELIKKINRKELSSTAAKTVLAAMADTGEDPDAVMQRLDLGQVSNAAALSDIVDEVLASQAKAVQEYKSGKVEVLKFLVGQVMAASKGKANPELVAEILREKLL